MWTRVALCAALAAGLAVNACHRGARAERRIVRPEPLPRAEAATPAPVMRREVTNVSPETRILSILHAKNEEEIRIGRLAQDRAASEEVKRYAEQLIQDHTQLDAQVSTTAQASGVTLMDPHNVGWMLAREQGIMPSRDPAAQLENLSGAEFDRSFTQKMRAGHQELIGLLEEARGKVAHPEVSRLIDDTLPRLHSHQQTAQRLVSSGEDGR